MSAFIIAEAGVNHQGDIKLAEALALSAKATGADAVKFQTFDAEKLEPPGTRRDMLKALELSRDDFRALKWYCDSIGLEFMSTPFDVESLNFLVGLGVKRIKIASGHMQPRHTALLDAAYQSGLPLIVSLGMGGVPRFAADDVTWLHCVSAYPVPVDDNNLRAMTELPEPYGLSDHSLSTMLPSLAVAMGATVIEKHLTLNRNMAGPDHQASLEPDQFKMMVDCIRWTERALGDGIKRVMPSEEKTIQIVKEREAWRARS